MKKKVSVKKVVKKLSTKKTAKKTALAKVVMTRKPVIVDSIKCSRSFWSLFDRVKNHNFPRMMQRGNCLEDFIKFVEEMPEQMFQHLFVDPLDLTPIREEVYVGCECPTGTQCLCCKYKTIGTRNGYVDYLKMHEIQRYDIEIQHLRYLIKLQAKGVAVPTDHTFEEFFKRSGAPNQPTPVNTQHYTQSNFGVKEMVIRDEPVKMTQTSIDLTPEEIRVALDKAESRTAKLKLIADTIKKTSNLDDSTKADTDKMAAPEIQQKYFERKKARAELIENVSKEDENKELDTSFLSAKFGEGVETRPSLVDLKSETPIQRHLEKMFDSEKKKGFVLPDTSKLKDVLKTLSKYAEIIENTSDEAAKISSADRVMPSFWQDLSHARKEFEKFNVFYARKYADYVDSLRDLNKKEQEYLTSNQPSDKHSLQNNVLRHLNAQRDLEVMKKILNSAYDHFRKAEITQVEASQLQEEMSKYSNEPAKQLEGSYVVRNDRKVPFDIYDESHVIRRSTSEREQSPVVVEVKEPDISKKARDALRRELAELNKKGEVYLKKAEPKSDSEDKTMVSEAKPTFVEKQVEKIQELVLKDQINPDTDFPKLIAQGLSSETVEAWKSKYLRGSGKFFYMTEAESDAIDDPMGFMIPVKVSANRRRRIERLELLQKSI